VRFLFVSIFVSSQSLTLSLAPTSLTILASNLQQSYIHWEIVRFCHLEKTFWPNFKLVVPLFTTFSPNRALLCTLSSSLLFIQTAIYALPKRIESSCKGPFLILGTDWQISDNTSVSLCKAILGRASTADLMHIFCSSNLSQTDLVEALYQALELLEKYKSESVSSWDIMGLAIEAYRHVKMPPSLPHCFNIINPQKNRC
jgi:hypothetical protein